MNCIKIFAFLFECRICCFLYFFGPCFDILYLIAFLEVIKLELTVECTYGVYFQNDISLKRLFLK